VFVFISHLTVPPEDHDELERHFRERSGLVDSFPGFLYLQLLAPQGGTATRTFLTAWESRDAFRRYMQQPGARCVPPAVSRERSCGAPRCATRHTTRACV
jgi:heme-degrading monooxygenase HmoA